MGEDRLFCIAEAPLAGPNGGREDRASGCSCSKMADEETPLLQPGSGGRSSNTVAVASATENPEPALKRQRRGSAESAETLCTVAKGTGGGAETAPLLGSAAEEARQEGTEEAGAAAAAAAALDETVAVVEGGEDRGSGVDSARRRWGLARKESPPPPPLLNQPQRPRPSQGEGAEAAPARDAPEAAIGCEPAQCSNGAADLEVAPQPGEKPPARGETRAGSVGGRETT